MNQYQKATRKKEAAERDHIEGTFGQCKNKYGLNKIQARLKDISETWISCIFFVMNLINNRKKASSVFIIWQYIPHTDIEDGSNRIYGFLKSTLTQMLNFRLLSCHPNHNFQSTSKMIFQ